jgi:hypothetical protein
MQPTKCRGSDPERELELVGKHGATWRIKQKGCCVVEDSANLLGIDGEEGDGALDDTEGWLRRGAKAQSGLLHVFETQNEH